MFGKFVLVRFSFMLVFLMLAAATLPYAVTAFDGPNVSPSDPEKEEQQEIRQPDHFDRFRTVRVMTRNLYFGADLNPVISAPDLSSLLVAATAAYQQILATNIPERAAAVAAEIADTQPNLVGLQEATVIRTGPVGDPAPATEVQVDMVELILANLAAGGMEYTAIITVPGFDAEIPLPIGIDVRLTINDVILARTGSRAAGVTLSNVQGANYETNLTVDSPIGPLTFLRQWASVDVQMRGKSFRFITTHLESAAAPIRVAQAKELLAGPANTFLPTVMVGDFNSQPGDQGDAAATLIGAGLRDAWGSRYWRKAGFTCCQAPDLRNQTSTLDQRIDLVLSSRGFKPFRVELVGEESSDKTPSGLWPSDHAGVVASLGLR